MDTAVPTGLPCTPKEERPRLINANCTRAAESCGRVKNKNNKKVFFFLFLTVNKVVIVIRREGLKSESTYPAEGPLSKMRSCWWASDLPVEEEGKWKDGGDNELC